MAAQEQIDTIREQMDTRFAVIEGLLRNLQVAAVQGGSSTLQQNRENGNADVNAEANNTGENQTFEAETRLVVYQ